MDKKTKKLLDAKLDNGLPFKDVLAAIMKAPPMPKRKAKKVARKKGGKRL